MAEVGEVEEERGGKGERRGRKGRGARQWLLASSLLM
eukprot:CAMPEP_0113918380 /NCGR_PEP_ID=MMETSP0780_2-20120614/33317_1 /TAXON_ID=652834 /ORGANISM="Palpitomonas bilix" /LENGTH=36 /DNA_ID=CAMNT_0000918177 /DNA_START=215 /DNA_END=325 /DNA_ORIENTATION=- /assembly_acc=CAM_ASM_000599